MTVSELVGRLKKLKATADGIGDLSGEAGSAIDDVMAAFRAAYGPQELRDAIAAGEDAPSDLEERLTTATLLVNQERARGAS